MWHSKNWPTSPKVAPESYYEMEINFRPFVTFCNYSLTLSLTPTLAQVFAPALDGLNGPPKLATPFENGRKDTALKSPRNLLLPQIWQPFHFFGTHQMATESKAYCLIRWKSSVQNFHSKFRTLSRDFQENLIGTFFSKPTRDSKRIQIWNPHQADNSTRLFTQARPQTKSFIRF